VLALNEGFQAAFLAGAVMAALGVLATLVLIRREDSRSMIGVEAVPVT
jgi:hypothetical protein